MKQMLRLLAHLEQFLLAIIIITMVVLFSGAVLIREVSDDLFRRIDWVDEATRYLMVWMVFLGLGLALARGKHIAMTSYLDRFPERLQLVIRKVIDAVGLVFSLYIVWFGMDITLLVLGTGQASPTLGFTTAVLYLALPVGFALLALRYAASLFGIAERWLKDDSPNFGGH